MRQHLRWASVATCVAVLAASLAPSDAFAQRKQRKVIYQTPVEVEGEDFDWRTGSVTPRTKGETVLESATDPDRNVRVPGTGRIIDRWVRDPNGQMVHETGERWQSPSGEWHGTVNRQTTNPAGGQHNEKVHFYKPTKKAGTGK